LEPFWAVLGLLGALVTPLALEAPTGRCVTGFVLPLAQGAGVFLKTWGSARPYSSSEVMIEFKGMYIGWSKHPIKCHVKAHI
jgi:hypothetical protein